jgi:hypothetical protein
MHLDLLHKKGKIMKRLLILTFAVAAVSMMAESSASAQGYLNGYQFGVGLNNSGFHGYGHNNLNRRGYYGQNNQFRSNFLSRQFRSEQPPYFAKFPPVYYSHVVKRPYGVSPYAAPAGIPPVEFGMGAPVVPLSVTNPFFEKGTAPAKTAQPKSDSKTDMKTTWVANPYLHAVATR